MSDDAVLSLSEPPPEHSEGTDDLFDMERAASTARRMARAQSVRLEGGIGLRRGPRLLLRESYGGLSKAYKRLVEESRREQPLTPAADWLLDNFYVIRDAARQLRDDLPFTYYRVLPKLEGGALSGRPRIYEAVSGLAERTDNVLDEQHLWVFFNAFQEVAVLEMSELWALPAMARLVLLQRLSVLAAQVSDTLEEQDEAARWARQIIARATQDPSDVVFDLAEMAERYAPLSGSFVVTLADTLRAEGAPAAPALDWLERRLTSRSLTIDTVVHQETRRQTHRQASVANAVTSLRRIDSIDWSGLIESLSAVDHMLRRDPAGVYAEVDFPTRDRYRHVVERLARYSPATEWGVAERVVAMAAQARSAAAVRSEEALTSDPPVEAHVGYWLVAEGLRDVEREVGYRPRLHERLVRLALRRPGVTYAGSIALLFALLLLGAWGVAATSGAAGHVLLLALAASVLPALDLAVAGTHWLITRVVPPQRLPKLAFEGGVPPEYRTFVVVPTLLTSPEEARRQVEHLEVHALANPDPSFRFALASGFGDAPTETTPGDAAILQAAQEALRELNRRWRAREAADGHGVATGDRFFHLHRARRWNAAEGVWMGWERKRGQLEEFNTLLRDPDAATTYATVEGDFDAAVRGPDGQPNAVRYVLTLDADTQLPPGTARDLVRTAAHPLNRPVFDAARGRVVGGYGVLQPRIGIAIEVDRRTPFARIFSSEPGVDPYTTAVSDVYQDLFGVGIYTGKGLYDVDAFRKALAGAIPENTVLSHDLLEGNYARAALVTDVTLFDAYPSRYATFARRLHRWVRGDWQILPWLFGRVRDADGQRRKNPISLLGRWKTFDNLRRSLTPPSVLLFLLLGWTVLPGSPFLWTLLGVGILAFPIYARFVSTLLARPREAQWRAYLRGALAEAAQSTLQAAISVVFLAHQALFLLDAVGRALWRMLVSRKKLLEWTTAQQAEALGGEAPGIWLSPLAGAGVLALVVLMEPVAALVAVPFAAAWIAAPWVARRLSEPEHKPAYVLKPADRARLRRIARRTWRFFDDFVTEADHALVPDNFQEQPFRGLARRTSPTNVGMGLLAVQAAYDLGYETRTDAVARLTQTFETLRRLERHGGHFYNWYDTETTEPLLPRYVSTVDSGNLVAALITLRQALLETPTAPWPNPALFDGLRDTLACLDETLADARVRIPTAPIADAARSLRAALPASVPERVSDYRRALHTLHAPARALRDTARAVLAEAQGPGRERTNAWSRPEPREELRYWAEQPLQMLETALAELDALAPWATSPHPPDALDTAKSLQALLLASRQAAPPEPAARSGTAEPAIAQLLATAAALADEAEALALAHDFRLLYDVRRDLFFIGYNADSGQADSGTYDLLASECRIASLVAVGKGDVDVEHWFRLGRPTTSAEGFRTLVSWSGTMFEYLMPLLFTRLYPGSLLEETCVGAVGVQQAYARRRDRPWGLSESAYNRLDVHLTYQYRAFGVPGLGLKRGLADDYVAAPYATLLSLFAHPDRALANLSRLREMGAYGPYGYYEAVDFTPERVPEGQGYAVVQAYMAHHQGMGLLAIANVLTGATRTSAGVIQRRFHREPLVRSSELLLQERVPRELDLIVPHPDELEDIEPAEVPPPRPTVVHIPAADLDTPTPLGLLLANGRHTTLVTAAGAGFARVNGTALTRWTPDRTREHDGVFLYVRDVESGRFWSAGMQPCGLHSGAPDRYEAWFHLNKAEIARVDDWIETFTEVTVSPEDDVEVRRYTLTNYSDRTRDVELTSYAEVVLSDPAADAAHPAFSKLFVRTEADPARGVLLATRRAREAGVQHPWLFHTTCCEGSSAHQPTVSFETDRMRFVGRNRSLAAPAAMDPHAALTGTTGAVLDPIVSLRRRLTLRPKEKQQITFVLGTAPTRDAALRLADRYRHPEAVQRAFDLAGVYGLVELPHFGLTAERALYAQQLATVLLYGAPHLRAPERVLMRNRRGPSGLWAYGISGDLPILVARIGRVDEIATVRSLLKMHAYWRQRGLAVDLVLLNAHPPSYADDVQRQLQQAVEASASRSLIDRPGGVFVRRTDGMPEEDLTLILTAARVVVEGALPDLVAGEPVEEPTLLPHVREPLAREAAPSVHSRLLAAAPRAAPTPPSAHERAHPDTPDAVDDEESGSLGEGLLFFNGYGGFAPDGREYVVRLDAGSSSTPLPWSNVVANERFGFLATESGLGMVWQGSSQLNRLTPWSNDPVIDPAEDALYLRDEDESVFWSPTPRPVPGPGSYETRHGWGFSRYRHTGHGIESDLLAFVPREDPVQIVRLRLTNRSERPRRLTAFRYAAWVLGDRRERSEPFVVVRPDLGTGALFARNRYNSTFSEALAFADAARLGAEDPVAGITSTADRTAFLGRGGTPANPAALRTARHLDGHLGAGLDPCVAFAVPVTLQPGETAEVVFLLGQAAARDEARSLIHRYRDAATCEATFDAVREFWRDTLGGLHVETPDPALDVLVNGWLLYQNLACRLWARSAFYQSGGALGFRDQLQDACALLFTRPDLTRAQLLVHAAHQFKEGDVLHWWHPQTGAGIRTRFSDDLLWLPYATATYLQATGDQAVLDEEVSFLTARLLEPGEDEAYLTPEVADEAASLYEHGCRALDRSLTEGPHGLPLMGSGDWNDGMNRVGHAGRGESVWLGFFLFDILDDWIPLCKSNGDADRAERYRAYQARLRTCLNESGWDGAWYRRAYYDDGTPLGSAANRECQIDAIAQAWAALSGAGDDAKVEQALASARALLVDEEADLIRLLTPPFDETLRDPGYIKSYPPGIRENGGQYTHGVLWLVRAVTERSDGTAATRLLRMLLPTASSDTREAADRYKTEPYAVAADVYGAPPHAGRGGWTWYTGSAGWMYRIAVESILGITLEGGTHLRLAPRIPPDWPGFSVRYHRGKTCFEIEVTNAGQEQQAMEATIDGEGWPVEQGAVRIPLDVTERKICIRVSVPGLHAHPDSMA